MEIASLISPLSAELPCGPDLEYDQEFMALDLAARGKPEQQFGDTIVPAEEPDWRDIKQAAEALFLRTKDLRVAVLLARALAHTDNFVGVAAGLSLIHQLLQLYWDSVHPLLDADDDNDPTMRLNALMPLGDGDAFIRDLRTVYLVEPGRSGRIAVRDILVLAGRLPAAGDEVISQAEVDGILRASVDEAGRSAQIDAARESLAVCRELQQLLIEKVGAERIPNLKAVSDILGLVVKLCDSANPQSDASATIADSAAEDGSVVATAAVAAPGALRTRDDAIRMLDRICEFIERTEPSHPAPLLLRRAQRLMNMSFVEIIEDLAPDGLSQMRNIAGLDKE